MKEKGLTSIVADFNSHNIIIFPNYFLLDTKLLLKLPVDFEMNDVMIINGIIRDAKENTIHIEGILYEHEFFNKYLYVEKEFASFNHFEVKTENSIFRKTKYYLAKDEILIRRDGVVDIKISDKWIFSYFRYKNDEIKDIRL